MSRAINAVSAAENIGRAALKMVGLSQTAEQAAQKVSDISKTLNKGLSKHKSLHDPTRVITERERHAMWAAHMQQTLELDPTNEGMTIIMARNGRTHRFVIPAYRLPNINSTQP